MAVKFTNNATTTLAGSISSSSTSLSVASGTGVLFPALSSSADWFMATLVKLVAGTPVQEIVKVTARSSDAMTIVRAQEGTTATTFAAGDKIELRITAKALQDVVDAQRSTVVSVTANTSTTNLDLSLGDIFLVTVAANTTINFTNAPSGAYAFTVHLINDATAGRTVAFQTAKYADGAPPPRTTAANATDIYSFYTVDSGATYIGAKTYNNIS